MYYGTFRGMVKSMLRKNPELRPSAAELLNHPRLQPYILKVHLKLNNPRRSTFPFRWTDTNHARRSQFVEPESVSTLSGRVKRLSFSNDRALNPSISGTEAERNDNKSEGTKLSIVDCMQRLRAANESAIPRRQTTPSKIAHTSSKRDSLPASSTPAGKFTSPSRRASLPLPTRSKATTTPYRANIGLLRSVDSPDISVNAPRIDKMAEFSLAPGEDHPLFPVRGTSSTSAQCSSSTQRSVAAAADYSITKDKCTIQVVDKSNVPSSGALVSYGNECSQHVATAVSSHSSANSHQRKFDTSSYQQRAEALEGLLEFSARLLQQQRFEELEVLLKPFGPEKVSPRETAIWLTRSFKETVV
ncbi:hypothetical protein TSUD_30340 [Trifolium subterraneum]|uniref:Protein kinase domain-containing protein n=1 Tax=Trifolium subterraneum TaxID=3900 RepID=A0A2Z6NZL7_TRISU|nr:hypothetical protein TSUD_30340 [Trifolium subterraneum]